MENKINIYNKETGISTEIVENCNDLDTLYSYKEKQIADINSISAKMQGILTLKNELEKTSKYIKVKRAFDIQNSLLLQIEAKILSLKSETPFSHYFHLAALSTLDLPTIQRIGNVAKELKHESEN